MKKSVDFQHMSCATAQAVATALLLCACGGSAKQTPPIASSTPSHVEPLGRTNAQPATLTPNTPTASSVSISEEVLRACDIADADAYFAFDSASLTSFDYSALDQVATCFTRGPMAGRRLSLVGHADPRGTTDYNMTLGQSRSDAVAGYLAAHGMERTKTTTSSRGAMDATGRDETGWAHDRRVDISLAK
jgi:peptidoglycan-associated lipoprotein